MTRPRGGTGGATGTCRACGADALRPLVDLGAAPAVAGALCDDRDGARSTPRGQLVLAACRACGHVENTGFDPALVDYDDDYDNSLHFSPAIQDYTAHLASRLADRYRLAGGHVVEIGSGRGDFLLQLCRLTEGTGTGYDPTCAPACDLPGVAFVGEYFQPGRHLQDYDLLVCRHVLEHLDDPAALLASLAADPPAGAVVYLEVPAAEFNFSPAGMWDCIYPHVSYFCASSLLALVHRCGLEVLDTGASFDGQFLWVEARPGRTGAQRPLPGARVPTSHLERLEAFASTRDSTVAHWRQRLAGTDRLALWGAGMKGVSFLNAVDPDRRLTVVDLNPRKWGRFLPGTGHVVHSPRSLDASVRGVLITNTAYRGEITAQLAELGVPADVVAV